MSRKAAFDSTRLQDYLTGRSDELKPGMRVLAKDSWDNREPCILTEVTNAATLNIRAVDSQGNIVLLNIWQIVSTLPTSVADVAEWADA